MRGNPSFRYIYVLVNRGLGRPNRLTILVSWRLQEAMNKLYRDCWSAVTCRGPTKEKRYVDKTSVCFRVQMLELSGPTLVELTWAKTAEVGSNASIELRWQVAQQLAEDVAMSVGTSNLHGLDVQEADFLKQSAHRWLGGLSDPPSLRPARPRDRCACAGLGRSVSRPATSGCVAPGFSSKDLSVFEVLDRSQKKQT